MRDRPRDRPPARGHRRRPLPAPRGLRPPQALLCVQTKSTLATPKLTFDTNEFFLKDSDEMAEAFAAWPEALRATLEIAERCDVELELGKQLIPRFPTPDGEPEERYLRARRVRGPARALRRPAARPRPSSAPR